MIIYIFRVLPKFLAWLCKRKYKIKVEIGRIGIPYLTLHDVNISKNGFSIVSIIDVNNVIMVLILKCVMKNFYVLTLFCLIKLCFNCKLHR